MKPNPLEKGRAVFREFGRRALPNALRFFLFLHIVSFTVWVVIDSDGRLSEFLSKLRVAEWVALDTEADSLHAYPEKLCLLQISTAQRDDLIDPLAPINLPLLWPVLHQQQLIMHGADYDLRLLRKKHDFVPVRIFDTMLASRLLGEREFGLSSLVRKYLGVTLEKGSQKADWATRPLTARMAAYARNDTHYLKPLADILREQLRQKERLGWLEQSCARLIADCSRFVPSDPDLVWRIKGAHRLSNTATGTRYANKDNESPVGSLGRLHPFLRGSRDRGFVSGSLPRRQRSTVHRPGANRQGRHSGHRRRRPVGPGWTNFISHREARRISAQSLRQPRKTMISLASLQIPGRRLQTHLLT